MTWKTGLSPVGQAADNYLVADKQTLTLICFEFAEQGMIVLSGDKLVGHLHRRGEQRFDAGLSGVIGDGPSQQSFADAGIASFWMMSIFRRIKSRSSRARMVFFCLPRERWKLKSN